jgi:hypothetical protein
VPQRSNGFKKIAGIAWRSAAVRLLLLTIAVVSTFGWIAGWYPQGARWGDVPTWVAAIATLAAVTIAIWAGVSAKKAGQAARRTARTSLHLLKIEQARDDEQRTAHARLHQADLVAAWHAWGEVPHFVGGTIWVWGATIQNGSPLPVYEVRAVLIADSDRRVADSVSVSVLPPGLHHRAWPNGPDGYRKSSGTDEGGNPIYTEARDQFKVELSFRDTAGREWKRDAGGHLKQTGVSVFPHSIPSEGSVGLPDG